MPIPEHAHKDLVNFFHHGRKLTYQKGEIILRAGDEPQGIYWIESGHVKIYALSKHGTEHTHLFYVTGDIFPMIWAFKNAIRNVYYQAVEETVVWLVPKDDFRAFAGSNAQVAMSLLEQAVDMFRLYAGRIDNLLYSNSHERTAYRLLSLIDRFGERQPDGTWLINVPVTHQDIASCVNLSRETVSRCLERLHRKGIVASNIHHQIVVKDLPALVHIIGEDEVTGMWPEFKGYLS